MDVVFLSRDSAILLIFYNKVLGSYASAMNNVASYISIKRVIARQGFPLQIMTGNPSENTECTFCTPFVFPV